MLAEIEVKIYSVVFSKILKEYHDCGKLHFPNLEENYTIASAIS